MIMELPQKQTQSRKSNILLPSSRSELRVLLHSVVGIDAVRGGRWFYVKKQELHRFHQIKFYTGVTDGCMGKQEEGGR